MSKEKNKAKSQVTEPQPEEQKQPSLLPEDRPEQRIDEIDLSDLPDNNKLISPEPTGMMIESVKKLGVLQPIIVTMTKDGPMVAAGRRRVKAARAAGLSSIKAVILSENECRPELLTITENSLRKSNAAAEYNAIKKLLSEGASVDSISISVGLTRKQIEARLRLDGLVPDLMEQYQGGHIKQSIAEAISRLPEKSQKRLIKTFDKEGKITHDDIAQEKRARQQESLASMPQQVFEPITSQARTWHDELCDALDGAKGKVPEEVLPVVEELKQRIRKTKVKVKDVKEASAASEQSEAATK